MSKRSITESFRDFVMIKSALTSLIPSTISDLEHRARTHFGTFHLFHPDAHVVIYNLIKMEEFFNCLG